MSILRLDQKLLSFEHGQVGPRTNDKNGWSPIIMVIKHIIYWVRNLNGKRQI